MQPAWRSPRKLILQGDGRFAFRRGSRPERQDGLGKIQRSRRLMAPCRPIRSPATSRAPGHSVPAATQRREAHRKNGFVAGLARSLHGTAPVLGCLKSFRQLRHCCSPALRQRNARVGPLPGSPRQGGPFLLFLKRHFPVPVESAPPVQVLPFVEPSSGREVVLIASVHFNPQLAQRG